MIDKSVQKRWGIGAGAVVFCIGYAIFANSVGGIGFLVNCCGALICSIVGGAVGFLVLKHFKGFTCWTRNLIGGRKEHFWADGEKDHIESLSREYEKTLRELRTKKKYAKDAASRALIMQQIKEAKQNFRMAMLSAKRSLW